MTLQEYVNKSSQFPRRIREQICQSVGRISTGEMEELLSKHETDPGNFDGKIETNLRELAPELTIKANHRISDGTKFNNDLFIQTEDIYICLEIEKGYMSRFEFDILKMQAFASQWNRENPEMKSYGVFIVPADNVVARHISGNSRESSYQYLIRLNRLTAQIQPLLLKDILIVGYSTSILLQEIKTPKTTPKSTQARSRASVSNNIIIGKTGMIEEHILKHHLQGNPLDLILQLRNKLFHEYPELREKLNLNSRYLGYANRNKSDALYIYIQKGQLIIDVRVSKEEAETLRTKGFQVVPRDNYQSKAGWLTGLRVPHDTNKINVIEQLILSALET